MRFFVFLELALTLTFLFIFPVHTAFSSDNHKIDIWKNNWEPVDSALRRAVEAQFPLDKVLKFTPDIGMDRQRLPFYENTFIVRIKGSWNPSNLFVYFLYSPDHSLVRLDGTSPPIHAHNAKYKLILTDNTVKSYLWFFTFFVRGTEGPFLIAESSSETFIPKPGNDADENTRKALTTLPRSTSCSSDSGKYAFRCQSIIMYSNAIFRGSFGVQKGGMVEMIDDEPIAADLSLKINAPINASEVDAEVAMKTEDSIATGSEALSTPGLSAEQRVSVERLLRSQTVEINHATLPFLAGIAGKLIGRCGEVLGSASERAELIQFTTSGASNLIFGSDYSNPDLRKGVGSQMSNAALLALGGKVGERIPCTQEVAGTVSSFILRSLRAMEGRADGGLSIFVRSCANVFNESKCTCLANIGRGVITDIHQRSYNRNLVYNIIQRNPLLGFQIGFGCGIQNY